MTVTESNATPGPRPRRWAPWWVYVVVILGANYLRQVAIPAGIFPEWAVVLIALTISGALFVLITGVYRAVSGG